jgi:hypothetical protein
MRYTISASDPTTLIVAPIQQQCTGWAANAMSPDVRALTNFQTCFEKAVASMTAANITDGDSAPAKQILCPCWSSFGSDWDKMKSAIPASDPLVPKLNAVEMRCRGTVDKLAKEFLQKLSSAHSRNRYNRISVLFVLVVLTLISG